MDLLMQYVNGHIEVYTADGTFLFSADSKQEAFEELRDAA